MRTRLLLVPLSISVLCAVAPDAASAQRDGDRERTVTIYRDRDGYRDRIEIPAEARRRAVRARVEAQRYRERALHDARRYRERSRLEAQVYRARALHEAERYRTRAVREQLEARRYRDVIRLRNQYRYRDRERYRYDRRRSDWVDIALRAAEARHRDHYDHGRRYRHVGRGVYIDIDLY